MPTCSGWVVVVVDVLVMAVTLDVVTVLVVAVVVLVVVVAAATDMTEAAVIDATAAYRKVLRSARPRFLRIRRYPLWATSHRTGSPALDAPGGGDVSDRLGRVSASFRLERLRSGSRRSAVRKLSRFRRFKRGSDSA